VDKESSLRKDQSNFYFFSIFYSAFPNRPIISAGLVTVSKSNPRIMLNVCVNF
jgi:hypothetical protein